ncbi:S9 family peptidase, partial [Shewanella sp. 0m-11]
MRIHSILTKKHLLAIGLGIAIVGCQSQPTPDNTASANTANQDSVVETIHGVQVADPYRYLEVESEKTTKWVSEQQQAGKEYLANIENKQAI